MVTSDIDLAPYLASDDLVQSDDPEIARTAAMITAGAADDREKAVKIFYWVRDSIAYCIEADRPASEVLNERRGVCVTKALLHVALLRAAGVPARIGHADYKKDVLRAIFPDSYMDRQPDVYPLHTFAEVYLDGEWVTCDATLDPEFARDFGFPLQEFDGVHATDTMVGEANTVRRYSSRSGTEMMELYNEALAGIDVSHEELKREFQLLDVYVELRRIRKRMDGLERAIVNRL
ncbi:MAG TPA: transglutaminase family protein [Chloroflexota bacterium]|nr:transglutaminase family protein [Chloroflexota bacterium]